MLVLIVQIGMTAATIAFAAGYYFRNRDNPRHRKLMALGFFLTLATAVALVAGVHLFGATYQTAPWLISLLGGEANARIVLLIHRGFSTLSLVLLIAQVYSGVRRLPIHRKLHKATVPAWLISYVSGMIIFG